MPSTSAFNGDVIIGMQHRTHVLDKLLVSI